MADTYPFLNRIQGALEAKNQTLKWLAGEIGRTDKWFYTIKEFNKIEYGLVEKISGLIDLNLGADYNNWRANAGETSYRLAEPLADYKKEKQVSVTLKLRGAVNAYAGFEELLKKIEKECKKAGFQIE